MARTPEDKEGGTKEAASQIKKKKKKKVEKSGETFAGLCTVGGVGTPICLLY